MRNVCSNPLRYDAIESPQTSECDVIVRRPPRHMRRVKARRLDAWVIVVTIRALSRDINTVPRFASGASNGGGPRADLLPQLV